MVLQYTSREKKQMKVLSAEVIIMPLSTILTHYLAYYTCISWENISDARSAFKNIHKWDQSIWQSLKNNITVKAVINIEYQ